jgi:hypothetical protein
MRSGQVESARDIVRQSAEIIDSTRIHPILPQRLAMAEGFGNADIRANSAHHLSVAKTLQQPVKDEPLHVGAEVDLHRRNDEAENRRPQLHHHVVIGPRKQLHAVEAQVIERRRHEYALGCQQRTNDDTGGDRRRIDQNDVVALLDRMQCLGQTARVCDLDRSVEIQIGGNEINAWFARRADGAREINPGFSKREVDRVCRIRGTDAKAKTP